MKEDYVDSCHLAIARQLPAKAICSKHAFFFILTKLQQPVSCHLHTVLTRPSWLHAKMGLTGSVHQWPMNMKYL